MKNFFYLFTLLCSMSLFTSCGDDDETLAPVEGKWNLSPIVTDDGSYVSGPLELIWTGNATIDIGLGVPLPVADIAPTIEGFANAYVCPVLTDFILKEGNFTATINGVNLSANGLVSYKLSGNNQVLLMLNLSGIIEKISGSGVAIDPSVVTAILGGLSEDLTAMIANGIPVNYNIGADNNSAVFFIDKSLISKLAPLMPIIANLLPSDDEMLVMVKPILNDFPNLLTKTDELKISLKVIRETVQ